MLALTLHPIVKHIKAEAPELALNAWYLDDSILMGSSGDLAAALSVIERLARLVLLLVDLHLNKGKSLWFIPMVQPSAVKFSVHTDYQGVCIAKPILQGFNP